jgi:hypothetical protein
LFLMELGEKWQKRQKIKLNEAEKQGFYEETI